MVHRLEHRLSQSWVDREVFAHLWSDLVLQTLHEMRGQRVVPRPTLHARIQPERHADVSPTATAAPLHAASTRRGLARRLIPLLIATTLASTGAIVLSATTAPAADAADNGQWSVFPVQPQGRQDRVAYFLDVSAGQTYRDGVTIKNRLTRPMFLEMRAADAFNSNAGGFAPREKGKPNTGVGAWIKMPVTSVTIPAKSQKTVYFTMTVPRNASPGDHVGAIMALDPTIRGSQAGGTVIGTTYEVGARVYARVQGTLNTQMSVENVQLDIKQKATIPFLQRGTGVIRYTVVNTGNTRINATEQISVTGLFGRSLSEFPARGVPEILPGGSFVVEAPWDGVPALDLVHVRVDLQAPGVSAGGDHTEWVVSWLFLLIVLGLIIAFMAYRWWRDRNREPQDSAPTPAAPSPFPSAVGGALPTTASRTPVGRGGRRRSGSG